LCDKGFGMPAPNCSAAPMTFVGVWGLLREACPPASAAELLVIADTLAYSRLVPTMAWETALAEAQQRAPGQVPHWQTQYAGRRRREVLADARAALTEAGLLTSR